jgi:hypothetical protein
MMHNDSKARMLAGCLAGTLFGPAGCYTGALGHEPGGAEEHDPTAGEDSEDDEAGSSGGPSDTGEWPEQRALEAGNLPPVIADPGPQVIDEDDLLDLQLALRDPDDDPLRVWATGLPPGAQWDEPARRLRFRPDFIQGDRLWPVTIHADDGHRRVTREFTIEVVDTIAPPEPEIVGWDEFEQYTRLTISQTTDEYLDSPGNAGRTYVAVITVPTAATPEDPAPVRIGLHGFATNTPAAVGSGREFRVAPHDPMNTYWWGYSAALVDDEPDPDPTPLGASEVPDYTQRRVLHLLGWLLETYPEADPTRTYVAGSSMGGAGALQIGLWYARHFAHASGALAQAVPRNHRPGRISQLEGLWGTSDGPLWDALDLTRLLRDSAEARDQYLFTRHGKDDSTIHFGAAVLPSPLTSRNLYDTLQEYGVGHLSVWDEGAHGPADPLLGDNWWDEDFSPIHDSTTFVRSDLAFPAFTLSSADGDPGDGGGNGKQDWNVNAGFAGTLEVPGDTGWNGEIAGALNRFLRWDATATVDTLDRFALPLHVHDGDGQDPPKAGYPSRGDRFDGELPVVVDVTPRRLQQFQVQPGERVTWSFGQQRGEVTADETGSLRIPGLELGLEWQVLEISRVDAGESM